MLESKGGLGKGLSALFEQKKEEKKSIENNKVDNKIIEIDIDKINTNPYQPREDFDEEKLNELAESIKLRGLIQPITVKLSNDGERYDLISGERRVRAAKKIGLAKLPAYIYVTEDTDKENMLMLALIENIQRDDLNPMELSDSFLQLVEEFGLTQEQVAEKVAKKRSTVANYLRLQKLPAEIKVSLRKNEIDESHARMILRYDDPDAQIALWKRILSENLSVRELEEITKKAVKPRRKREVIKEEKIDSNIVSMEEKLRLFFGTKVTIKSKTKFTGEIIIEYFSEEDLERIIEKCT